MEFAYVFMCWELCWQEYGAHGRRTELLLEVVRLISMVHGRGAKRLRSLGEVNNRGCFQLLSTNIEDRICTAWFCLKTFQLFAFMYVFSSLLSFFHPPSPSSLFFHFCGTGVGSRASYMPGMHSTAWPTSSAPPPSSSFFSSSSYVIRKGRAKTSSSTINQKQTK